MRSAGYIIVIFFIACSGAKAGVALDCEGTLTFENMQKAYLSLEMDLEQKKVYVPGCLRGSQLVNFCEARIFGDPFKTVHFDAVNEIDKKRVWGELSRQEGAISIGIEDSKSAGRVLFMGKCQLPSKPLF